MFIGSIIVMGLLFVNMWPFVDTVVSYWHWTLVDTKLIFVDIVVLGRHCCRMSTVLSFVDTAVCLQCVMCQNSCHTSTLLLFVDTVFFRHFGGFFYTLLSYVDPAFCLCPVCGLRPPVPGTEPGGAPFLSAPRAAVSCNPHTLNLLLYFNKRS